MTGATERFLEAARTVGLEPDVHRFPQGTKTAADAARAIGCDVSRIVKSLVFVADHRPVLALVSGSNRVDLTALAEACDTVGVRRATPEEARAATGFAVGGTPPFGHPSRIETLIDEDLLELDEVWAAAGSPDTVFPVASQMLARLAAARPAALAERS